MPTQDELHTQIQYRLVEKLAESERKYRQLLENLTEVVFELNAQGELLFLNPAWQKTTGYSISESLGCCLQQFWHPEDHHLGSELLSTLLAEGRNVTCELRLVKQTGEPIWVEILAQPTANQGGSGTLTDITNRKQTALQLEYQASHDMLTGLSNRSAFVEMLEAVQQGRRSNDTAFAVMFFDLDRFKCINDTFGHHIGDLLLVEVARRLQAVTRASDCLARLGGDEFCLLLTPMQDTKAVLEVVQRIQDSFKQVFLLEQHEIVTDTSIGVMICESRTQLTATEILQNADVALYRAKASGRGRYAIFDQEMHRAMKERLTLERYLRIAIAKQDFELHYQPIVNLKDEQVIGFEALLRWHHVSEGWIPPGQFIPIAEESGLIVPLGWQVLEQVCVQKKQWNTAYPEQAHLFVSVNFASLQFLQPNFVSRLLATLQQTQILPTEIKIEITETSLMTNFDLARQILKELNDAGLQISIDDFGTGYSSLNYLIQLPINTLKIDRSFLLSHGQVNDIAALCKTIISLAHRLEMDVIAEGVELAAQAQLLKGWGCEMGQGYFWGRPMPNHQIVEQFLASDIAPSFFREASTQPCPITAPSPCLSI